MRFSMIVFACLLTFLSGTVVAGDSVWDRSANEVSVDESLNITVYYSPSCGCCGSWMDHLQKHQFNVTRIPTADMNAVKSQHGLPAGMGSCHTAVIDGYIIEGHVPAGDIKQLLKDKPSDIAGLSVPEMPVGTPGMEMGIRKDPFAVMAFDKQGKARVYKEYKNY